MTYDRVTCAWSLIAATFIYCLQAAGFVPTCSWQLTLIGCLVLGFVIQVWRNGGRTNRKEDGDDQR